MNIFNELIVSLLPLTPKPVVARFARPYIAGEELADAIRTAKALNAGKAKATVDVLGEDITTREEAIAAREECKRVLAAIADNAIDANLSVKLTQLGLKIDTSFCRANVEEILDAAKERNNFVRIDMEDHTCTDDTLAVFHSVKERYANVGIVIQAYLKRSENDVRKLASEQCKVRLCKGIYNEPAEIAFKKREEIQQNYLRLLRILFYARCYVGIATHDELLINGAKAMIGEMKFSPNEYEFQMLLGVRNEKRNELIRDGHRLRVYTPYGKQWYAYSLRRLRENPQIAGYVAKSIFLGDS
ncbi:MAG TPA: proline dehydrogenase family protein [Bacteroidota bacterium]|nr:proline dehydrogenase family protein [Bacteroidota bacterium]